MIAGVSMLAFVVLFFTCLMIYLLYIEALKVKEQDGFCPQNTWAQKHRGIKISGHAVVLVDTSNRISEEDGKKALINVENWMRDLPYLKKISIYGLPANEDAPLERQGKSWCVPKEGKDANRLYENPRHAELVFKGKFLNRIKRLLNDLIEREETEQSPIIETMANLARESGDIDSFFIISDMLQNSSLSSHYKNTGDMRTLCETVKLESVTIYYIKRGIPQQSQRSGHKGKWEACFSNSQNVAWVK